MSDERIRQLKENWEALDRALVNEQIAATRSGGKSANDPRLKRLHDVALNELFLAQCAAAGECDGSGI